MMETKQHHGHVTGTTIWFTLSTYTHTHVSLTEKTASFMEYLLGNGHLRDFIGLCVI